MVDILVGALEMQDGTNAYTPTLFVLLLNMMMLNIATVIQPNKGIASSSKLPLLLDVFTCLADCMAAA
jgi:hypothetical protein